MTKWKSMWIGTSFVLALASGCVASVGTPARVPKNAAEQCTTQCQTAGMTLSALVIVSSNIGCVCNPPPVPGAPAAACTNTPGAGAAVSALLQRQEEEARQQAHSDSTIRSTK